MTEEERTSLITALEALGSEADDAALAAAREVHRLAGDTGLDWEAVLDAHDRDDDDDAPYDSAPLDLPADMKDTAAIIQKLLESGGLSSDTREDLKALQEDIAEGDFAEMDSRYVHDLAQRLSKGGRKN